MTSGGNAGGSGTTSSAGAPPTPPSRGNADAAGVEITTSVGQPAAGAAEGPPPTFFESFFGNPLNLILLLFVAFYLFLLLVPKPGQKERKALQERLASLKKNDRVVLTSGIHGVVANINTEAGTVTVRVDESTNTRLTVDRASIRSVVA